MTLQEAYSALGGPLNFGDEYQLTARDFLRTVAEARQALMRCKRCRGSGMNKRDTGPCPVCVRHYPPDVLLALGVPRGGPVPVPSSAPRGLEGEAGGLGAGAQGGLALGS